MRKIKFRAWDKRNEEWLEAEDKWDKRKVNVFSFYSDSGWSFKDIIFMQYTGLKDKNGKEIYEGDIIKYKHIDWRDYKIDEVVFWYGAFVENYYHQEIGDFTEKGSSDIRVIGNICKNKEILDGN